ASPKELPEKLPLRPVDPADKTEDQHPTDERDGRARGAALAPDRDDAGPDNEKPKEGQDAQQNRGPHRLLHNIALWFGGEVVGWWGSWSAAWCVPNPNHLTTSPPRHLMSLATDHVPYLALTDTVQIDQARPGGMVDEALADQLARLLANAGGGHIRLSHQSCCQVDRGADGTE